MGELEQRIKDFVKEQGIEVVGVAGPERLNGPPSLDPTYTLKGAQSIVSMAAPMDVSAIHKFLGKESYTPHSLDQTSMNQKMRRTAEKVAEFIRSLGHSAQAVPTNNSYRRSLDVLATYPSFSHRFGAIASGIAAQGWSGNVMTEEYGAAMYLSTVVTDARLESDEPRYQPRHFIDGLCKKCKICEKTCVAGMFEPRNEEYILINNELHPRAKRRSIELCNASCFGLHSLSRDKSWTTWGTRWIEDWIGDPPDPYNGRKLRKTVMIEGFKSADSTPRYDLIKALGWDLHPDRVIDDYVAEVEEMDNETERFNRMVRFAKDLKVRRTDLLRNERILTCGNCALVCGPDLEETTRRYQALTNGGFIVPGPNDEVTKVKTYDEAVEMRKKHDRPIKRKQMIKDIVASAVMWHSYYFGIEPKSISGGREYKRRLREAVKKQPKKEI